MAAELPAEHVESEVESPPGAQIARDLLRFVLAVRYRKNVVIATMVVAALLGALYFATATRYYGASAALLVSQTGPDTLNASMTGEESLRRNTMPTFENMIRSAKVLEGAIERLGPDDFIDLAAVPQGGWVGRLQKNLYARTVRSTSILEIGYKSQDPRAAANVVRAVVESYLDFMDQIHKGTTGEIRKILVQQRGDLADKLAAKQEELLAARRHFADMGFRADGKTLHPLVQRAVYFNDALSAVEKQRVELEASLAAVERSVRNGEDLGQHLVAVADAVGRELLLSSLGLGARDATAQASLEQSLIADRAQLATVQQNLGPAHPEVIALSQKVHETEQFLQGYQERIIRRVAELRHSQLGPWLVQIVQQKLDEVRQKEAMLQARFDDTRSEAIDLSGQMAEIETLERDVKRLSDMNDVMLNQIASLDLRHGGQEIRVAVIQEPVVAGGPISPRLSYVVLASLIGGFGIGLVLVHLLDALDDRFRSIEEMQRRLGVPVLSLIQHMQVAESAGLEGLVMHTAPASAESEAFRTLRTALELAHPEARQIVVSSAEAGDGKTTILANLAIGYAQCGKRTLLVDADLRRPGLTSLMGLRGPSGLSEVLRSEGEITEVAPAHVRPSGVEGLDVLPSGPRPTHPAELLGSPRLSQLLAWAETAYDQILVDSPPALATSDAAIIGRLVDGMILVVHPAKNRRRLVLRLFASLSMLKIPALGIVLNQIHSSRDAGYYGYHGSYGFDIVYAPNYDNDEPAETKEPAAPAADELLRARTFDEKPGEAPRGRIVPRRVA